MAARTREPILTDMLPLPKQPPRLPDCLGAEPHGDDHPEADAAEGDGEADESAKFTHVSSPQPWELIVRGAVAASIGIDQRPRLGRSCAHRDRRVKELIAGGQWCCVGP